PEIRSGIWRGRWITYQVVEGQAVLEGDMLLERVVDGIDLGGIQPEGFGIAYPGQLWPKVGSVHQGPYVITSGIANVNDAITTVNGQLAGVLQWVPRTSETDFVEFNLDPNNHSGGCFSFVGRIGGSQAIAGSIDCAKDTIVHEMGHSIGLYHEQSRD